MAIRPDRYEVVYYMQQSRGLTLEHSRIKVRALSPEEARKLADQIVATDHGPWSSVVIRNLEDQ